jgi:Protein of unknown function (DUF429)
MPPGSACFELLTLKATIAPCLRSASILPRKQRTPPLAVPLGWPDAFVAALTAHHALGPWPTCEQRDLRFRRTDYFVRERTDRWPLSVSTDRIAIPAFRAARLLSPFDVDRTGQDRFVAVYPRAARHCFRLGPTRSVAELEKRAPWLRLTKQARADCDSSEDCFDALIAALVARAAACGLCEPIPDDDRAAACREGWVALPLAGTLERLAV